MHYFSLFSDRKKSTIYRKVFVTSFLSYLSAINFGSLYLLGVTNGETIRKSLFGSPHRWRWPVISAVDREIQ